MCESSSTVNTYCWNISCGIINKNMLQPLDKSNNLWRSLCAFSFHSVHDWNFNYKTVWWHHGCVIPKRDQPVGVRVVTHDQSGVGSCEKKMVVVAWMGMLYLGLHKTSNRMSAYRHWEAQTDLPAPCISADEVSGAPPCAVCRVFR